MWTITDAVIVPRPRSHGFAETLDGAKTAFAATCHATTMIGADRLPPSIGALPSLREAHLLFAEPAKK
jgi:hypothetical protein